jgi:hypothetical protein
MNMHERERDERLQAEAEAAERLQLPPGGNAVVNEYRLVMRALRQPIADGLPADFAARVARRMMFAEERGSFEDWMISVLMLLMAAVGLYFIQPLLADVAAMFQLPLPALPWPLLGAAALAIVVAWAIDQGVGSAFNRDGNRG